MDVIVLDGAGIRVRVNRHKYEGESLMATAIKLSLPEEHKILSRDRFYKE